VTLLNAAGALMAAGVAKDIRTGLQQAAAAIDDGKAREKLDALAEYTQENG
jgi:anthranilate phosphoribosyltransferase